jgi:hypothetical protein
MTARKQPACASQPPIPGYLTFGSAGDGHPTDPARHHTTCPSVRRHQCRSLYAIADREITLADGDPEIVFCVDEFGPLNLQPRPGRQWAAVSGKNKESGRTPRPRMRATYTRTGGIRHLFAACKLGEDKLFGHIKPS